MVMDFGVLLLLIALVLCGWSIQQVFELRGEVAQLRDPVEYDKAIESSMERIRQKKFALEATKNLADWQASSDQATPDRTKLYGSPTARFTIVEYSDLECPYCRNFHATPKYLVDNSKGNVNWQWKHLPLSFHEPAATAGAVASECVYDQKGSQGFWAFTNQWFKLSQGNGKGPTQAVSELAASVGVDIGRFEVCVQNSTHDGVVTEQKEYGTKIGITGTPASMIIDNVTGRRMFVKGGVPVANFAKAINELAKNQVKDDQIMELSEVDKDRLAISNQVRPAVNATP